MEKITDAKKGKGKTAAIDFDGVIHGYSNGWQKGVIYDDPVSGAKEALQTLKDHGYRLLIYSTRSNNLYRKAGDPDQMEGMKAYLDKHEIPYDKIHQGGKPMAEVYVDDRAIGFRGNWDETLEEVLNFQVWTKLESSTPPEGTE